MPNELYKFPNNIPSENIFLWWDSKSETWHIWFGKDEMPMFADGEFTPFREKLFHYKLCEKP